MDLQSTEDDPLQAALATAFTDSPILSSRPSAVTSQPPDPEPAQEQPDEGGGDESWKEEYEQHLSHWRAESAAAREKAQQERERWRLIREREREQEKEREKEQQAERERERGILVDGSQRKDSEWETVTNSSNIPESAPKDAERGGRGLSATEEAASAVQDIPPRYNTLPAGERDLVTGEMPRGSPASPIETPGTATTPPSNIDDHGLSSSRNWEEVPSIDSSFPSLSFPERSAAASPDPRERPLYQEPPAAPSVTLAIFDSSLSRRTRTLALISSLAINMFLPFVNGVMLGFGEIFAKNVVSFFGWNLPSTAVGIRAAPRKR